MMMQNTATIEAVFISPKHNFAFREDKIPDTNPDIALDEAICVAGRGIEGDRFFDFQEDYLGQVTFFAVETYEDLCVKLGITDKPASTFRRNIITRGVDLNTLIGKVFTIQGVKFLGTEEASPCVWMDRAFGRGALKALVGRGGLRAKILQSGTLRPGPMNLSVAE